MTGTREWLTWVTDAASPVDHAVTDEKMAAGIATRGEFVAVCGARFTAAAMCVEPGRVCRRCRLILVARV